MKGTFLPTLLMFTLGLFITSILPGHDVATNKDIAFGSVLGRSYPPAEADIKAGTGATITVEDVSLIVSEGTFSEDVYFRVDRTARVNPISVQGLWQVSDMWEARVKYMLDSDQVTRYDAAKKYILAFPYAEEYLVSDQGVYFPESTLKVIRGETVAGPWSVLDDSVVDVFANTVSVRTDRGGFFMIAGGFYEPEEEATSAGASNTVTGDQANAVVLKDNEIVITITPSPIEEEDDVLEASSADDTDFESDEVSEVGSASGDIPFIGGFFGNSSADDRDNFFTAIYAFVISMLGQ